MAKVKNMRRQAGEDMEQVEHSSLLVGVQSCTTILEINMVASQKLGINLPQYPAISLLGIYSKDAQSYYRKLAQQYL